MKKNTIILLIILILFIILLFLIFRSIWLPLIPFINEESKLFIKFIDEKASLLQLIISIVMFIIVFLVPIKINYKKLINYFVSEVPLKNITVNELILSLGKWGSQIKWVDRNIISLNEIQSKRKIVFIGDSKVGKNREAIQSIIKIIDNDIVLQQNIYEFSYLLERFNEMKLKKWLFGKKSLILYIDDLSLYYDPKALRNLDTLLEIIEKSCPKIYLFTTINEDKYTDVHQDWIEKHKINEIRLIPFNMSHLNEFIENTISVFHFKVNAKVKQILINSSDKTPEYILSIFRYKYSEKKQDTISQLEARRLIGLSSKIIWSDNYNIIENESPIATQILFVINIFKESGCKPYKNLVIAIVAYIWIKEYGISKIFLIKRKIKKALNYLSNFDIVVGKQFIIIPEISTQEYEVLKSQLKLLEWILIKKKLLKYLLFKLLFRVSEECENTLFIIQRYGHNHPNLERDIKRVLEKRKKTYLNKFIKEMNKLIKPKLPIMDEVLKSAFPVKNEIDGNPIQYNSHITKTNEYWFSLGLYRMRNDNYNSALEAFSMASQVFPTDPKPYYAKSLLYIQWTDWENARKACNEAIKLDPSFAYAYHVLGYIYLFEYKLKKARNAFQKSIKLNPNNINAILGITNIFLIENQPKKALVFLNNQKEMTKNNIKTVFSFIKIITNDTSKEEVEESLILILLTNLPIITDIFINNKISFLQVRFRFVFKLLSKYMDFDESDYNLFDVFLYYAQFNIITKNINKAITLLEKVKTLAPRPLEVDMDLGKYYLYAKMYKKATINYCDILDDFPENIDIITKLIQTYIFDDQIDKALDKCYQAIKINAYSVDINIYLALCFKKLNYENKFNDQINILNNIYKCKIDLSRIEAIKGNIEKAIDLLLEMINTKKQRKNLFNLAIDIKIDPCFIDILENDDLNLFFEMSDYDIKQFLLN